MLLQAYQTKPLNGFTLVELSIVIVIIGLIIAGVITGNSLVKQAKYRSLITSANEYNTAVRTFKLQYDAFPGDLSTAASYWPDPTYCTNATISTDPTKFCNGNNSKTIDWANGTRDERSLIWYHLSLAKLIEGGHTGNKASGGVPTYPRTAFGGDVGFHLYGGVAGLYLASGVNNSPWNDGINPYYIIGEMASFDSKYDDGLPNTGWITDRLGSCVVSAAYNLAVPTSKCALQFTLK